MPDPNKLAILRMNNYVVREVCGLCQHFRGSPGANFGSCNIFIYTHKKHGPRQLSVSRYGRCSGIDGAFEMNKKKQADIDRSGFTEFVEKL